MEMCKLCTLMMSDVKKYDREGLSGNNPEKHGRILVPSIFIMVESKQFLFGSKLSLIENKLL